MSSAPTMESALAAFAALPPCGNASFAGHLQTLSVHLESDRVNEDVLKTLAHLTPSQLAFCAPLLERFLANKSSVGADVVVLGKLRGLALKIPEAPDPSIWK